MSAVWMVRHGKVTVSGVCYGQYDVATEMDASEAAAEIERMLAELGAPSWNAVWCSPWKRTEPVAALVAARSGVPLRTDPRLSELSFGEWEGLSFSEIEGRFGERFSAWMSDYDSVAPPGGEAADALVRRVASWLFDVEREGGAVLAVCHAGTIRAARAARAGARFSALAQTPVSFLLPERV